MIAQHTFRVGQAVCLKPSAVRRIFRKRQVRADFVAPMLVQAAAPDAVQVITHTGYTWTSSPEQLLDASEQIAMR